MYKKIGMVPNVQSLVALWSSLEHSFILRNILSKYLLLMNVKSQEKVMKNVIHYLVKVNVKKACFSCLLLIYMMTVR